MISAIGDLSAAHAEHELDVCDLVVAPGFIDAHTHSDLTCYQEETLSAASVRQGVTTKVCGNCGFSPFPFLPGRQGDVRRHVGVLLGPQAYSDLPTWRAAVEEQGFYSNLVSLVGHGSLRAGVFGFERRAPRSDDLDHMVSLAQASLEQGAAGLSSGLIYTPGAYAETTEIVQLCRRALPAPGALHVPRARRDPYDRRGSDRGDRDRPRGRRSRCTSRTTRWRAGRTGAGAQRRSRSSRALAPKAPT